MTPPTLEPLCKIRIERGEQQYIGPGPYGHRHIHQIKSGSFEGDRLKGLVLPGGADWLRIRTDGVCEVDVRLTMQTHDEKVIYMSYTGLLTNAAEVDQALRRGDTPDPSSFSFYMTPRFETGAREYAWLNSIVSIARGQPLTDGVEYDTFAAV